ncbi:hypothetical protein D0863_15775 [Hortaea werneckii]|uniref:Fe2OG dioxygenase domain-containing protein n=1 Tax=Hortaea werneckii TaxID=91943 RepID=A0A3M7C4M2_HORWE|nr:hypothetical protein D0863_15775 [Hortaea werneckii]
MSDMLQIFITPLSKPTNSTTLTTFHTTMAAASPPPSPTPPTTEPASLAALEAALQKASRRATFTCAGRLPLTPNPPLTPSGALTPRTNLQVHEQTLATKPVVLRWGAHGTGKILSLPLLQTPEDDARILLLSAATDGIRAGALGPGEFMTDFCPYEAGIVDVVTQVLVPPIVGDLESSKDREDISDVGRESGLNGEEDRRLRAAMADQRKIAWKYTRGGWGVQKGRGGGRSLHIAQLGVLLEELDVPFADEDEAESVEVRLDPEGTGCLGEEDVFAFAAARLGSKRRRRDAAAPLPPDLLQDKDQRMLCRGLRAELYKLNVYSGPEGFFKPHVDTPRSASQIGSLVVCLPVEFSGGALAVRHQGQEIVHEWGTTTSSPPAAAAGTKDINSSPASAINWTAFYSDCEHEVLPLHAGQRITLTYNLYLSRGTSLLNTGPLLPHRLLPHQLPLASHLHQSLANPQFKPEGGYLAFWLRHRYPLTHPVECEFVVEMLKGADLGVLGAVRAVGLRCSVERVEHFAGGRDVLDEGVWGRLEGKRQRGEVAAAAAAAAEDDYEDREGTPVRTSFFLPAVETTGSDPLNPEMHEEPDEDYFTLIETKLAQEEDHPYVYHCLVQEVLARERRQKEKGVTWIGREGRQEELSGAYLVYGNEAELSTRYSSAALVVRIPSWAERRGGGADGVRGGTREDPMVL